MHTIYSIDNTVNIEQFIYYIIYSKGKINAACVWRFNNSFYYGNFINIFRNILGVVDPFTYFKMIIWVTLSYVLYNTSYSSGLRSHLMQTFEIVVSWLLVVYNGPCAFVDV